jgi:L-asparaginase/Glu-tRNA(Gln) amidotransferase subunit D
MHQRLEQGKYKTSQQLLAIGVISAGDMTLESTLCKLMFLLTHASMDDVSLLLAVDISGERSHFES